jgi:hypothetical protein
LTACCVLIREPAATNPLPPLLLRIRGQAPLQDAVRRRRTTASSTFATVRLWAKITKEHGSKAALAGDPVRR